MKYFIITMLISLNVFANESIIYNKIVKLNPKVDTLVAKKLAESINKYKDIYNINENISIAIAMQESGIKNINRVSGDIITDYGIFQIHYKTVEYLNISVDLLNNIDYNTQQHMMILRRKIDVCKKLKVKKEERYGCYHSYNYVHRFKYLSYVSKHLEKLND